jgi:hypothetical protein
MSGTAGIKLTEFSLPRKRMLLSSSPRCSRFPGEVVIKNKHPVLEITPRDKIGMVQCNTER